MSNKIPELLEMLYNMISEAWGLPLGAEKCVIERDKALDLLDDIKRQFPTEFAEAKRLAEGRDEFINNVKREAAAMKAAAEERAKQLINEQEIIKVARAKSNEMLSNAEKASMELRARANEYVDGIMGNVEDVLSTSLEELKQTRARLRQAARTAPQAPQLTPPPPEYDDDEEDYDG